MVRRFLCSSFSFRRYVDNNDVLCEEAYQQLSLYQANYISNTRQLELPLIWCEKLDRLWVNRLWSQFNDSNNSAIQVLFWLVELLAELLVNLLLESRWIPIVDCYYWLPALPHPAQFLKLLWWSGCYQTFSRMVCKREVYVVVCRAVEAALNMPTQFFFKSLLEQYIPESSIWLRRYIDITREGQVHVWSSVWSKEPNIILQFRYEDAYVYKKEMPEQNIILATRSTCQGKEDFDDMKYIWAAHLLVYYSDSNSIYW
jgi:hypothetical protein